MHSIKLVGFILFVSLVSSCTPIENNTSEAMFNITFIMDEEAQRLNNFGDPVSVPSGNDAQNPDFEILGLHFIGLYQDKFTPFDKGASVFSSPTTEIGGSKAIDFANELFITESQNTLSIPLSEVQAGTYEYFRSSIGFQKYKINYNLGGASNASNWPNGISDNIDVEGTIASFIGFNNYIETYDLLNETVTVNDNKTQGYFGLETNGEVFGQPFSNLTEGDAGQTTVSNPIDDTSPVPAGSCVVTGKFPFALTIPENATEDVNIQVIISINKSFEWNDDNGNGKYEPLLGEQVVDMGTRGLFPSVL